MRTAAASTSDAEVSSGYWVPPLRITAATTRSCCCPSPPVVQVLLPPTEDRPATDLVLCAHHYRVSLDTLMRQAAWIYGVDGYLLGEVGWSEDPATSGTDRRHADRSS